MAHAFNVKRGSITHDDQYGHVCTCSRTIERDADGEAVHDRYSQTVSVARYIRPTESGSWWYVCSRCGAGGWSGL